MYNNMMNNEHRYFYVIVYPIWYELAGLDIYTTHWQFFPSIDIIEPCYMFPPPPLLLAKT
jgi:hypothetical protein